MEYNNRKKILSLKWIDQQNVLRVAAGKFFNNFFWSNVHRSMIADHSIYPVPWCFWEISLEVSLQIISVLAWFTSILKSSDPMPNNFIIYLIEKNWLIFISAASDLFEVGLFQLLLPLHLDMSDRNGRN